MISVYSTLEHGFKIFVQYGIMFLETISVCIILVSAVTALVGIVRGTRESKYHMPKGVALALSFLLGGEAMKTIIAPDWRDIGMTCAIIVMRAAMVVLIHWETKSEREAERSGSADVKEATTGGADIGK